MNCFLFKRVGLAILCWPMLCLSASAMPQDKTASQNDKKEISPVEMILRGIGRDLATRRERSLKTKQLIRRLWVVKDGGRALPKSVLNQDSVLKSQVRETLSHELNPVFYGNWKFVPNGGDMGLKFESIEEDYLRTQLGLGENQGLIVSAADESAEGFKNGFRAGDIVLSVDGENVDSVTELMRVLTASRGSQCSVKARRGGSDVTLSLKLPIKDANSSFRWILGIYPESISDLAKSQLNIKNGIVVNDLTEGGAAGKSGIVKHDIITHIDGTAIHSADQLRELLADSNGEELKVDFVRMGNSLSVTFAPEKRMNEAKNTPLQLDWSPNYSVELPKGEKTVTPYTVRVPVVVDAGKARIELLHPKGSLNKPEDQTDLLAQLKELEQRAADLNDAIRALRESVPESKDD